MTNQVFAQGRPLGILEGLEPLGVFDDMTLTIEEALGRFNQVIENIVGILTVIAGIWFIFQFIIGGIVWLTAGNDKAKVESARAKITQGIIGLGVVIAAVFIIDLIGTLLGLEILRPGKFVIEMWP